MTRTMLLPVRPWMGSGASSFCARAMAVAVMALVGSATMVACGANESNGAAQAPNGERAVNEAAEGGAFLKALSAAGAASDPDSAATITSNATAAVRELAEALFRVELTCKDGSADESTLCAHPLFTDVATRYQRRWGHEVDPERDQGRIDALPRLGGPDVNVDQVVGRIVSMCNERCAAEATYSWARRVSDVIDGCKSGTAPVTRSCAAIKVLRAGPEGTSVGDAVERCVSECTETRKDIATDLAFEKRRPRTKAQAAACLKTCMKGCDPGGWCGTCEMGCQMDCAVAGPVRPAPLQE